MWLASLAGIMASSSLVQQEAIFSARAHLGRSDSHPTPVHLGAYLVKALYAFSSSSSLFRSLGYQPHAS